jgi:DNA-binding CsgD family transcriptional regulator
MYIVPDLANLNNSIIDEIHDRQWKDSDLVPDLLTNDRAATILNNFSHKTASYLLPGKKLILLIDIKTKKYVGVEGDLELIGAPSTVMNDLHDFTQLVSGMIIPPDLPDYQAVTQKGCNFYFGLSPDERKETRIIYYYRVKNGQAGEIRNYLHQINIEYSKDGIPILAINIFTDVSFMAPLNQVQLVFWNSSSQSIKAFTSDGERSKPGIIISNVEKELLFWMSEGTSSKEIALKLNKSLHTIHTQRKELMFKTKSRNTAQLIALAIRNRWI